MDELKTIDGTKPASSTANPAASAKPKPNWILAGKIALAVACVLACVGSMWLTANRTAAMFDHDPWQEFLKNLTFEFHFMWRDSPPFTAAGVIGLAGTVVLWVLFFLCRDMVTGLILLPMCILLPLHLVWANPLIMVYTFLNPLLLLMLAPAAIESFASRKRFRYLGTATGICAVYLVLSFICSGYFWVALGNRGD